MYNFKIFILVILFSINNSTQFVASEDQNQLLNAYSLFSQKNVLLFLMSKNITENKNKIAGQHLSKNSEPASSALSLKKYLNQSFKGKNSKIPFKWG